MFSCLVMLIIGSGCLNSDDGEKGFRCSDGRIVSEPMLCIDEKTTTFTSSLIVSSSTSTVPPKSFPKKTSTSTVKPLVRWVSTTSTVYDTCSNGILDEDEEVIDCGGSCFCRILNLSFYGDYRSHRPSGYVFGLNNSIIVRGGECGLSGWPNKASYFHTLCKNKKYVLNVTNPKGLIVTIQVMPGNSYFIDELEFAIFEEVDDGFRLAVRRDLETLNLTGMYRVFSVGGNGCTFKTSGYCRRKYAGYTFKLSERRKDEVRMEVIAPDGDILPGVVVGRNPVRIRTIEVGVHRPIVLGGFSTLYAHVF